MSPEILLLVAVAPLLLVMAASDVRSMRIPNWLILSMCAVFLVLAPFVLTGPEILARLTTAAIVLVVGFAAFIFRILAGGDVKALAALMLFVPSGTVPLAAYGLTFSIAMLLGMAAILGLRRAPAIAAHSRCKGLEVQKGYPMGLSIGMAGLALPLVLTRFL